MSQTELIKQQLRTTGKVSRNWCLQRYISRLGALIETLESKGWVFKAYYKETETGKDYIYELVKDPSAFNENVYSKETIEMNKQQYHNPRLF